MEEENTPGIRVSAWPVRTIREPLNGPALVGDPDWTPSLQETLGVRIVDRAHGAAYVVTIHDDGHQAPTLTSCWRAPILGGFEGVGWLPDAQLAAIAASFLRARASVRAALPPGVEYAEDRAPQPIRASARVQRPALDRIANEARLARQAGVPVTEWIGDRWPVSPATIDRWVRAAREAGLLPEFEGRAGRPRRTPAARDTAQPQASTPAVESSKADRRTGRAPGPGSTANPQNGAPE